MTFGLDDDVDPRTARIARLIRRVSAAQNERDKAIGLWRAAQAHSEVLETAVGKAARRTEVLEERAEKFRRERDAALRRACDLADYLLAHDIEPPEETP